MKIFTIGRTLALVATLTAAAAGAPARADDDVVKGEVSTHGLDLTSPADRAALRHAIASTARHVCLRAEGRAFPDIDFQMCVEDAFNRAWAQAEVRIAAARSKAMVASAAVK